MVVIMPHDTRHVKPHNWQLADFLQQSVIAPMPWLCGRIEMRLIYSINKTFYGDILRRWMAAR